MFYHRGLIFSAIFWRRPHGVSGEVGEKIDLAVTAAAQNIRYLVTLVITDLEGDVSAGFSAGGRVAGCERAVEPQAVRGAVQRQKRFKCDLPLQLRQHTTLDIGRLDTIRSTAQLVISSTSQRRERTFFAPLSTNCVPDSQTRPGIFQRVHGGFRQVLGKGHGNAAAAAAEVRNHRMFRLPH